MFFQFVKKVEEEKNTKDGNDAKRAQVTSLNYIYDTIYLYIPLISLNFYLTRGRNEINTVR